MEAMAIQQVIGGVMVLLGVVGLIVVFVALARGWWD